MSATNAFESDLLSLIFTNVNIAGIGDATGLRGSSSAGVFWIALYTGAGPGEAGDPTNNEATFGSYARISVARTTDEWTVADGVVDNDNDITYVTASSGSNTITYVGICTEQDIGSPTAGDMIVYAQLSTPRLVETGVTPRFVAGTLDISVA